MSRRHFARIPNWIARYRAVWIRKATWNSRWELCVGNEKTYAFLEEVLGQVVELFPGAYVHIGGDECPKALAEVVWSPAAGRNYDAFLVRLQAYLQRLADLGVHYQPLQ